MLVRLTDPPGYVMQAVFFGVERQARILFPGDEYKVVQARVSGDGPSGWAVVTVEDFEYEEEGYRLAEEASAWEESYWDAVREYGIE